MSGEKKAQGKFCVEAVPTQQAISFFDGDGRKISFLANRDEVLGLVRAILKVTGHEVVTGRAWRTDENFGHDYWMAKEYSLGRGTHNALIVVGDPVPEEKK